MPAMAQSREEDVVSVISSDVALFSINIDSDKMATVRHTSDFRCFDFSSSEWS